jgi:hypothetical protein
VGVACAVLLPFTLQQAAPRPFGVPGLALVLAPGLAATAHVAVLGLTELTWPRPTARVRAARLAPRDVTTFAPPLLRRALVAAAAALVVVAVAGALLAAPGGRSVSASSGGGESTAGPFPGLPYGLAAVVAVALLLGACVLVLRLVVRRPAVEGADDATDAVLRRASAHRVLRGALAGALATLGPLLAFGGTSAGNVLDGGLQVVAHLVTVAGIVVVVLSLVVLLVPAPAVPWPAPAPLPQPAR